MNQPKNSEERAILPGAALKAAREGKGVTPAEAAEATRIKVQIIEAIERDDFSRIAAPTYAKGFIRLYAEFLGLDPEPLLNAYADHHQPTDPRRGAARRMSANGVPGASDASGSRRPRWIDTLPLTHVAARVALAVGTVVVVVLLLTGLVKLVSRAMETGEEPGPPAAPPEADWTLVAEPPDPVLALPRGDADAP